MKSAFRILLPLTFLACYQLNLPGQVTADFTAPDTICVGEPVNIINLSTGGSTYYWNFCSGNLVNDPIAQNVGNPGGTLNIPAYINCVKDGNDCFSFTTNQGLPSVSRHYHGTSFKNDPIANINFGSFGLLVFNRVEGIQIKKDNGKWYGFVNNDVNLVRLNFGNSLWNIPTATNIPIPLMNLGHGLGIIKEGTTWIGFLVNAYGNNLLRLNFGTSLVNTPSTQDLGNIANFSHPSQLQIISENNLWYIFVMNNTNNTISRISFGSSLLNTPSGINLGTIGVLNLPVGITIMQDCDSTAGYFTNWINNGLIGRLTFSGGLLGTITCTVLPFLTNYNHPHAFSEIIRESDSLFIYVTIAGTSTLTRLVFLPCNNSSIPSSKLFTPSPYSYTMPGTYHIRLVVNEGMPDEVTLCKSIVLRPGITVDLGPDLTICRDSTAVLDAGGGYSSYLWSTGDTMRTLQVTRAGSYWVTVKSNRCEASDTLKVLYSPVTTVDLGPDTTLCGGSILLNATVRGSQYVWQDGSKDSVYLVQTPGDYRVSVTLNGCSGKDSIKISPCQSPVWFPNAFTPNGDGKNETFHAVGAGVDLFQLNIFNRWGEQVFETNNFTGSWDGTFRGVRCSTGVYFYIAKYSLRDASNKQYTAKGSVTLLR